MANVLSDRTPPVQGKAAAQPLKIAAPRNADALWGTLQLKSLATARKRKEASDIRHTALQSGMKTLRQDGIEKVLSGLTALSQVVAATKL